MAWGLSGALLASLAGCGAQPASVSGERAKASAQASAKARQGLGASVVQAAAVPADTLARVQDRLQRNADDASRRRKIDFFALHANPVGLKLTAGDDESYVLSFLGTSKTRTDLNIEMRALVGERAMGSTTNYTGPVTLGRAAATAVAAPAPTRGNGFEFDLLLSAPPAHIDEAYGREMERLAKHLADRYDARPVDLLGDVTPFTIERAEGSLGYVFCAQRNTLVLGDRKYADVQVVTAMGRDGQVLASYTLVGFNEKTTGADAPPTYRVHDDGPHGPIFEFGDY
ncbi:MAG: hypothetical protein ACK46X_09470 [Candidatus Sericytochromatia bacterium]